VRHEEYIVLIRDHESEGLAQRDEASVNRGSCGGVVHANLGSNITTPNFSFLIRSIISGIKTSAPAA
jgi:hypothetical protein